jgi:carbonic anhydrase
MKQAQVMSNRILVAVQVAALAFVLSGHDASLASGAPAGDTPAVSADEALKRLLDGNARFVAGTPTPPSHDGLLKRRSEVATTQHPFAVIVGCSDSRVGPEVIFDQGLGDVFVIRTAGEVMDAAGLGSIEYAVEHLGASLIVVLGHQRCGAVDAAVKGAHEQGHIADILSQIAPVVAETKGMSGDPLDNAVRANAIHVAKQLESTAPILSEKVHAHALKVLSARYDLDSGKVEILPDEAGKH